MLGKPKKGYRLGSGPSHQKLMMMNLVSEIINRGEIETTLAKAKAVKPIMDKVINTAKKDDIHARRQIMKFIRDKKVVNMLFAEIAPKYEDRNSGYTRIFRVAPRKGDNAPMCIIRLI